MSATPYTAHIDRFAATHLPPPELQPEYLFDLPELQFPERLNCAAELLDRHVAEGRGERLCLQAQGLRWTYADLQAQANRIANVLTTQMGLVPGNRVLLCAPNNPMMVASWFAVVKAGGIAVAAMPLLRAKELGTIIEIAQISHALCDAALLAEVQAAQAANPRLQSVRYFNGTDLPAAQALEPLMAQASPHFDTVQTAATDTCLLGFTSGTTGVPKATMHFHRDVMAVCACWPRHVLRAEPDDVFIGSPPLAFTFGLGGQVLFPMAIGASMALLEKAGPAQLVDGIEQFGATVVFTAPTSYRVMAQQGERLRQTRLRKCVGRRGLERLNPCAVERRHRHRDHRRHRLDRDAAHLYLPPRGRSPAGRHGPRGAGLPRQGGGCTRPGSARRHGGQAGRARPHGLPLLERQPPDPVCACGLEPDR